MVLYMFLSVVATFITEGIIFAGIYFYETEILAGEYRRVWGSSGQGKLALGMLSSSGSVSLDILVILIFTILLLVMYFILISHNFVTYVREIINGVEKMKSGDFQEEIPVKGEDEFSEIAYSINEMCRNLSQTLEAQKETEKTKDELITNVAHDLRTPLTSILGYLDLLSQGDFLTEDQKQKYLGIVSNKARQLETLVKDLFDYTRYDRDNCRRVLSKPHGEWSYMPDGVLRGRSQYRSQRGTAGKSHRQPDVQRHKIWRRGQGDRGEDRAAGE